MFCTVSVGGGVGLGAIKRVQISPKPALITTQVLRASHKHQPELFVKELVCQGVCGALLTMKYWRLLSLLLLEICHLADCEYDNGGLYLI